jgi:hypothetical protein
MKANENQINYYYCSVFFSVFSVTLWFVGF